MEWSRVNVDLWGPKSVQNKEMSGTIKCMMMYVMTMLNPVTRWLELIRATIQYSNIVLLPANIRINMLSEVSKTKRN